MGFVSIGVGGKIFSDGVGLHEVDPFNLENIAELHTQTIDPGVCLAVCLCLCRNFLCPPPLSVWVYMQVKKKNIFSLKL